MGLTVYRRGAREVVRRLGVGHGVRHGADVALPAVTAPGQLFAGREHLP
jgi:hypothetical protein